MVNRICLETGVLKNGEHEVIVNNLTILQHPSLVNISWGSALGIDAVKKLYPKFSLMTSELRIDEVGFLDFYSGTSNNKIVLIGK